MENPGSSERLTSNGTASVCNAIIQEGMTRVRCAFWRDMAEKLASVAVNTCILLYQVLVSKKPGDTASWELGSWRGTQILPCPDELAEHVKLDLTWFATNCMTICRHILTSFPVLVHIIINVVLFSKVFECSMLQSCYCPCLLR